MSLPAPAAGAVLLHVMWSAVVASVVVAIAFSLAILGFVRWTDVRAGGRAAAAAGYALLAAVGTLAFIGAVVYGLVLVTQKS